MENLGVFVPVAVMDLMTPVVQQIDGPGVTAYDWFALRFSADGAEPATHCAASFMSATNAQKSVLVNAGVGGVWIGTLEAATHEAFIGAAFELGLSQIIEEV